MSTPGFLDGITIRRFALGDGGIIARDPSGPPCWHCGRPTPIPEKGEGIASRGLGLCSFSYDCRPSVEQRFARACALWRADEITEFDVFMRVLGAQQDGVGFQRLLAVAGSSVASLLEMERNRIADGFGGFYRD